MLILALVAIPPAVLVALRFEAPRGLVARKVDVALSELFRGRLRVTAIERIDLGGVRVTGSITDAGGKRVIAFRSVTVRLEVPRLLLDVVRHGVPRSIAVDEVLVPDAEVALLDDGSGTPTLAHAFDPRVPSPAGPPGAPPPTVTIAHVRVEHAWVHGTLGGAPPLDVDVTGVQASLGLDHDELRLGVTDGRLAARLEPRAPNTAGKLAGALRVPLGSGASSARAKFEGALAATAITAEAALHGSELTADAQLPRVGADDLRRWVRGLTLRGTLRISAHAAGTLPKLAVRLDADGDPGTLAVEAELTTSAPLRLHARAVGRRLDASALTPSAPATRADADAELTLEETSGALHGDYTLALHEPWIGAERAPEITTHGTLRSADGTLAVNGEAKLVEPGARADVGYGIRLVSTGGRADVTLDLGLDDPPRLVRAAGVRLRRGSVKGRGSFSWPDDARAGVGSRLEAQVDARLGGVEAGAVRLGPTGARVELVGTPTEPYFTATLSSGQGRVAGRDLTALGAHFAGTRARGRLGIAATGTHGERLAATTELHAHDGVISFEQTSAMYRDGDGTLLAALGSAKVAGSRVEVVDVTLSGAGELRGSFWLDGPRFHVAARADELDVVRLAQLARVWTPLKRARASFAVDAGREQRLEGELQGEIRALDYDTVRDGSVSLVLGVREDAWSGRIVSELVPGARVIVDLRELHALQLLGPAPRLPEGALHAQGRLDFDCMTPLFAAIQTVPVERARGTVDLDIDYRRSAPGMAPDLAARLRTHALELLAKRPAGPAITSRQQAVQAAPSVYGGVDMALDLGLDASSRALVAHLGLHDREGELLTADAAAGPLPDDAAPGLGARLAETPFEVHATFPARRLTALPPPLRPASVRGMVSAEVTADGTPLEPHVVADVRASRLRAAAERAVGEVKPRLAVLAHAEYRTREGSLALVADAQNRRVVDARVEWTGELLRAASEPAALSALTVRARAKLDHLDLETIAPLKNRQLEGIASGTAELRYGPSERLAFVDLVAEPLRSGQATVDRLNATLRAEPGALSGALTAVGQSGSVRASVESGLDWPRAGSPKLAGDIVAALKARNFRLATLWPLTSASLNELDGRLDADLGARVEHDNVALSGSGRLHDGVVQVPALGQRFSAISASIAVAPGAIVIEPLEGRGVTGRFTGGARVELDQRLGLHRLDARVEVPKHDKLPVTVSGADVGDAWGKVEAHVTNEPERITVRVVVPEFHVELPDSDHEGVQDLAPDEDVRVGVRRQDAVFTALPVQPLESPVEHPTPVDVTVELRSVALKKGDLVTAELTGSLAVATGERTVVTGRIDLTGGSLDVSGKRFEIERGTVTFTGGDPSNPSISAEARWDAPSDYTVRASYTGTARQGHLTLRSEPPLTEEEIVNLILFGAPAGGAGAGAGGTAAGAVSIAGGTAARGLNRALSDFTRLNVQARVDTSTGAPRPELVIPVTRRLSARVTRAIGEPAAGATPDRTFLTLELRLKRESALSVQLGDRGASAFDLVWRRRY